MPIKNDTERRKYYRELYHRTREQALDYMAHEHARKLLHLAMSYADQPAEREQKIAAYLKGHCKFKPGVVK